MADIEQRANRITSFIGLLAGMASVLAGIGALLFSQHIRTSAEVFERVVVAPETARTLGPQLQSLDKRIGKIESIVSDLSKIPETSAVALELKSLQSSVSEMSKEVDTLDKVILANPEKALEVPLLRRDMDNMKDNYQSSLSFVKDELNRVYGLGEWFIGLMFTMAIGILSLAISNFLPKGK